MQGPPTYRVYSAADLKSIAPATLRTAPAPKKSGFFGFGFVLMVTALIGGATFAAQHYLDVKGAEKATAGGSPFSMSLAAPASSPPPALAAPPLSTAAAAAAAADAGTSAPEAVAATTPASRLRRKMIHRRAASASAPLPPPPDPNALPGVPGFVAPAPPATLPPNPF